MEWCNNRVYIGGLKSPGISAVVFCLRLMESTNPWGFDQ